MKNYLLNTIPLNSLISISKVKSRKLAKIGLHTVQDLLLHFPFRYENRTYLHTIKNLIPGVYATVEGVVLNYNLIFNRRKIMTFQISDGSGILTLCFFNFSIEIKNHLIIGRRILAYGEVEYGKYGKKMIHPEYYINFDAEKFKKTLTPIYPTIGGIRQMTLRKIISQALDLLNIYTIDEFLPEKLRTKMMSLSNALRILHCPPLDINIEELKNGQHPAQRRLIFEELLTYNLSILALRSKNRKLYSYSFPANDKLKNRLLSSLSFELTNAQLRAVKEIEEDMELNIPMMRLIQGDVGSGKTLVAALAALRVISHGKQVVLMAPTELLVKQHVNNFRNWFTPLGIKVGWLIGNQKGKVRKVQQNSFYNGQVKMIIGTHAIFQNQIKFNALALIIIDEQHRFGVYQRLALWKKGLKENYPHQLNMTATPIPRTLAMTTFSDLNISTIDELPSGRTPITTVVIPDIRRGDIIKRINNVCISDGRQVYWICTLIEKSEFLQAKAAKVIWQELKLALPKLNVGLIHGRMKSSEKKLIIKNFEQKKINLLVSTTAIEVGIDIPNVSVIVIENSERLGLSQLHQLRGRVGRSSISSYCILLYKSPLSKDAKKRLQILRDSNNGFIISQKDLEIRGPGEFFGARQTGRIEFKIANLTRDRELIPKIKRIALYIHKHFPDQEKGLIDRWKPKIKYF